MEEGGALAFSSESQLGRLMAAPMRRGHLVWIGLRPARRADMLTPASAILTAGCGIAGDRYRTSRNGERQVTLIAAEDIAAVAAFLGRDAIAPDLLRRNFVIRGVNIVALKGQRFRVGAAVLEGSGDCAPCSRMEDALGEGGYNAMRGHGGITARIIESGAVRVGDGIERIDPA